MNEVKRYVNTVERHLHLDRSTRLRVMNDLASDLQSRLDAGETLADIQADLGDARTLAETLNFSGPGLCRQRPDLTAGGRFHRYHRRRRRPHGHLCGRFLRRAGYAAHPFLAGGPGGRILAAGPGPARFPQTPAGARDSGRCFPGDSAALAGGSYGRHRNGGIPVPVGQYAGPQWHLAVGRAALLDDP